MGHQKRFSYDNDAEFTGRIVDLWGYTYKVTLEFSRHGTPTDNPHITSFNETLLDKFLNANCFSSVMAIRQLTESWRLDYNDNQPQMAHNGETSTEFAELSDLCHSAQIKIAAGFKHLARTNKTKHFTLPCKL